MVIFLSGIFLRIFDLANQPPTEDDIFFVFSAENYMERGYVGPSMWHHPNLRNILLYFSLRLLGKGPVGVWGVSLIAGILSLILISLIALELFKNRAIALLSTFFLAIDPLHISFSRQAIQESTTLFFILAGVYFALLYLRKHSAWGLWAAGFAFDFGIASKWQAAFSLLFFICWLIYSNKKGGLRRFLEILPAMVLLPVSIYIITFIPWFSRGYGFLEWLGYQKTIYLMNIHHVNPVDEAIDNPGNPLLWFLKPVGYGSFAYVEGRAYVTIAMGNFLVWMLTIPSIIFLIVRGIRERHREKIMLMGFFFISYFSLLLASTTRDIYVLSALPVIPFAFMAIAYSIIELSPRLRYGKMILALYIIMVSVVSFFMYPMSIAKALEYDYLKPITEQFNPHR